MSNSNNNNTNNRSCKDDSSSLFSSAKSMLPSNQSNQPQRFTNPPTTSQPPLRPPSQPMGSNASLPRSNTTSTTATQNSKFKPLDLSNYKPSMVSVRPINKPNLAIGQVNPQYNIDNSRNIGKLNNPVQTMQVGSNLFLSSNSSHRIDIPNDINNQTPYQYQQQSSNDPQDPSISSLSSTNSNTTGRKLLGVFSFAGFSHPSLSLGKDLSQENQVQSSKPIYSRPSHLLPSFPSSTQQQTLTPPLITQLTNILSPNAFTQPDRINKSSILSSSMCDGDYYTQKTPSSQQQKKSQSNKHDSIPLSPSQIIPIALSLDKTQSSVVTTLPDGCTSVTAGPGSGKTRVLIARLLFLVFHHKISGDNIVAITFTRAARLELFKRYTLYHSILSQVYGYVTIIQEAIQQQKRKEEMERMKNALSTSNNNNNNNNSPIHISPQVLFESQFLNTNFLPVVPSIGSASSTPTITTFNSFALDLLKKSKVFIRTIVENNTMYQGIVASFLSDNINYTLHPLITKTNHGNGGVDVKSYNPIKSHWFLPLWGVPHPDDLISHPNSIKTQSYITHSFMSHSSAHTNFVPITSEHSPYYHPFPWMIDLPLSLLPLDNTYITQHPDESKQPSYNNNSSDNNGDNYNELANLQTVQSLQSKILPFKHFIEHLLYPNQTKAKEYSLPFQFNLAEIATSSDTSHSTTTTHGAISGVNQIEHGLPTYLQHIVPFSTLLSLHNGRTNPHFSQSLGKLDLLQKFSFKSNYFRNQPEPELINKNNNVKNIPLIQPMIKFTSSLISYKSLLDQFIAKLPPGFIQYVDVLNRVHGTTNSGVVMKEHKVPPMSYPDKLKFGSLFRQYLPSLNVNPALHYFNILQRSYISNVNPYPPTTTPLVQMNILQQNLVYTFPLTHPLGPITFDQPQIVSLYRLILSPLHNPASVMMINDIVTPIDNQHTQSKPTPHSPFTPIFNDTATLYQHTIDHALLTRRPPQYYAALFENRAGNHCGPQHPSFFNSATPNRFSDLKRSFTHHSDIPSYNPIALQTSSVINSLPFGYGLMTPFIMTFLLNIQLLYYHTSSFCHSLSTSHTANSPFERLTSITKVRLLLYDVVIDPMTYSLRPPATTTEINTSKPKNQFSIFSELSSSQTLPNLVELFYQFAKKVNLPLDNTSPTGSMNDLDYHGMCNDQGPNRSMVTQEAILTENNTIIFDYFRHYIAFTPSSTSALRDKNSNQQQNIQDTSEILDDFFNDVDDLDDFFDDDDDGGGDNVNQPTRPQSHALQVSKDNNDDIEQYGKWDEYIESFNQCGLKQSNRFTYSTFLSLLDHHYSFHCTNGTDFVYGTDQTLSSILQMFSTKDNIESTPNETFDQTITTLIRSKTLEKMINEPIESPKLQSPPRPMVLSLENVYPVSRYEEGVQKKNPVLFQFGSTPFYFPQLNAKPDDSDPKRAKSDPSAEQSSKNASLLSSLTELSMKCLQYHLRPVDLMNVAMIMAWDPTLFQPQSPINSTQSIHQGNNQDDIGNDNELEHHSQSSSQFDYENGSSSSSNDTQEKNMKSLTLPKSHQDHHLYFLNRFLSLHSYEGTYIILHDAGMLCQVVDIVFQYEFLNVKSSWCCLPDEHLHDPLLSSPPTSLPTHLTIPLDDNRDPITISLTNTSFNRWLLLLTANTPYYTTLLKRHITSNPDLPHLTTQPPSSQSQPSRFSLLFYYKLFLLRQNGILSTCSAIEALAAEIYDPKAIEEHSLFRFGASPLNSGPNLLILFSQVYSKLYSYMAKVGLYNHDLYQNVCLDGILYRIVDLKQYSHILCDEGQDTSEFQQLILFALTAPLLKEVLVEDDYSNDVSNDGGLDDIDQVMDDIIPSSSQTDHQTQDSQPLSTTVSSYTNQTQRLQDEAAVLTRSVFLVGDPNQSIYTWRNANLQGFLSFFSHYRSFNLFSLLHNYRSTADVVYLSNLFIPRINMQNRIIRSVNQDETAPLLNHPSTSSTPLLLPPPDVSSQNIIEPQKGPLKKEPSYAMYHPSLPVVPHQTKPLLVECTTRHQEAFYVTQSILQLTRQQPIIARLRNDLFKTPNHEDNLELTPDTYDLSDVMILARTKAYPAMIKAIFHNYPTIIQQIVSSYATEFSSTRLNLFQTMNSVLTPFTDTIRWLKDSKANETLDFNRFFTKLYNSYSQAHPSLDQGPLFPIIQRRSIDEPPLQHLYNYSRPLYEVLFGSFIPLDRYRQYDSQVNQYRLSFDLIENRGKVPLHESLDDQEYNDNHEHELKHQTTAHTDIPEHEKINSQLCLLHDDIMFEARILADDMNNKVANSNDQVDTHENDKIKNKDKQSHPSLLHAYLSTLTNATPLSEQGLISNVIQPIIAQSYVINEHIHLLNQLYNLVQFTTEHTVRIISNHLIKSKTSAPSNSRNQPTATPLDGHRKNVLNNVIYRLFPELKMVDKHISTTLGITTPSPPSSIPSPNPTQDSLRFTPMNEISPNQMKVLLERLNNTTAPDHISLYKLLFSHGINEAFHMVGYDLDGALSLIFKKQQKQQQTRLPHSPFLQQNDPNIHNNNNKSLGDKLIPTFALPTIETLHSSSPEPTFPLLSNPAPSYDITSEPSKFYRIPHFDGDPSEMIQLGHNLVLKNLHSVVIFSPYSQFFKALEQRYQHFEQHLGHFNNFQRFDPSFFPSRSVNNSLTPTLSNDHRSPQVNVSLFETAMVRFASDDSCIPLYSFFSPPNLILTYLSLIISHQYTILCDMLPTPQAISLFKPIPFKDITQDGTSTEIYEVGIRDILMGALNGNVNFLLMPNFNLHQPTLRPFLSSTLVPSSSKFDQKNGDQNEKLLSGHGEFDQRVELRTLIETLINCPIFDDSRIDPLLFNHSTSNDTSKSNDKTPSKQHRSTSNQQSGKSSGVTLSMYKHQRESFIYNQYQISNAGSSHADDDRNINQRPRRLPNQTGYSQYSQHSSEQQSQQHQQDFIPFGESNLDPFFSNTSWNYTLTKPSHQTTTNATIPVFGNHQCHSTPLKRKNSSFLQSLTSFFDSNQASNEAYTHQSHPNINAGMINSTPFQRLLWLTDQFVPSNMGKLSILPELFKKENIITNPSETTLLGRYSSLSRHSQSQQPIVPLPPPPPLPSLKLQSKRSHTDILLNSDEQNQSDDDNDDGDNNGGDGALLLSQPTVDNDDDDDIGGFFDSDSDHNQGQKTPPSLNNTPSSNTSNAENRISTDLTSLDSDSEILFDDSTDQDEHISHNKQAQQAQPNKIIRQPKPQPPIQPQLQQQAPGLSLLEQMKARQNQLLATTAANNSNKTKDAKSTKAQQIKKAKPNKDSDFDDDALFNLDSTQQTAQQDQQFASAQKQPKKTLELKQTKLTGTTTTSNSNQSRSKPPAYNLNPFDTDNDIDLTIQSQNSIKNASVLFYPLPPHLALSIRLFTTQSHLISLHPAPIATSVPDQIKANQNNKDKQPPMELTVSKFCYENITTSIQSLFTQPKNSSFKLFASNLTEYFTSQALYRTIQLGLPTAHTFTLKHQGRTAASGAKKRAGIQTNNNTLLSNTYPEFFTQLRNISIQVLTIRASMYQAEPVLHYMAQQYRGLVEDIFVEKYINIIPKSIALDLCDAILCEIKNVIREDLREYIHCLHQDSDVDDDNDPFAIEETSKKNESIIITPATLLTALQQSPLHIDFFSLTRYIMLIFGANVTDKVIAAAIIKHLSSHPSAAKKKMNLMTTKRQKKLATTSTNSNSESNAPFSTSAKDLLAQQSKDGSTPSITSAFSGGGRSLYSRKPRKTVPLDHLYSTPPGSQQDINNSSQISQNHHPLPAPPGLPNFDQFQGSLTESEELLTNLLLPSLSFVSQQYTSIISALLDRQFDQSNSHPKAEKKSPISKLSKLFPHYPPLLLPNHRVLCPYPSPLTTNLLSPSSFVPLLHDKIDLPNQTSLSSLASPCSCFVTMNTESLLNKRQPKQSDMMSLFGYLSSSPALSSLSTQHSSQFISDQISIGSFTDKGSIQSQSSQPGNSQSTNHKSEGTMISLPKTIFSHMGELTYLETYLRQWVVYSQHPNFNHSFTLKMNISGTNGKNKGLSHEEESVSIPHHTNQGDETIIKHKEEPSLLSSSIQYLNLTGINIRTHNEFVDSIDLDLLFSQSPTGDNSNQTPQLPRLPFSTSTDYHPVEYNSILTVDMAINYLNTYPRLHSTYLLTQRQYTHDSRTTPLKRLNSFLKTPQKPSQYGESQIIGEDDPEDDVLEITEKSLRVIIDKVQQNSTTTGNASATKPSSNSTQYKKSHRPRVTISTIHGVKGLEYPIVFMVGCTEAEFLHQQRDVMPIDSSTHSHHPIITAQFNAQLDESCRLIYVAATRASERLFISYSLFDRTAVSSSSDLTDLQKPELYTSFVHPTRVEYDPIAKQPKKNPVNSSWVVLLSRLSATQLGSINGIGAPRPVFLPINSFAFYQCNWHDTIKPGGSHNFDNNDVHTVPLVNTANGNHNTTVYPTMAFTDQVPTTPIDSVWEYNTFQTVFNPKLARVVLKQYFVNNALNAISSSFNNSQIPLFYSHSSLLNTTASLTSSMTLPLIKFQQPFTTSSSSSRLGIPPQSMINSASPTLTFFGINTISRYLRPLFFTQSTTHHVSFAREEFFAKWLQNTASRNRFWDPVLFASPNATMNMLSRASQYPKPPPGTEIDDLTKDLIDTIKGQNPMLVSLVDTIFANNILPTFKQELEVIKPNLGFILNDPCLSAFHQTLRSNYQKSISTPPSNHSTRFNSMNNNIKSINTQRASNEETCNTDNNGYKKRHSNTLPNAFSYRNNYVCIIHTIKYYKMVLSCLHHILSLFVTEGVPC